MAEEDTMMGARGRFLLGAAVYLAVLWLMIMAAFLAFSLVMTGHPTYCHPRQHSYEFVLPARQIACLFADPRGVR